MNPDAAGHRPPGDPAAGVQRAATWDMADAWVFAAIADERPGEHRSLRDVISFADVINHAILTEHEFTTAVGRLTGAGLIGADADADRYSTTDAGVALRRLWQGGLFEWINVILDGLRRIGEPGADLFVLPEGCFEQAVDDYLKSFPS